MTTTDTPTIEYGTIREGGYTLTVSGGGHGYPVHIHAHGMQLWLVCTITGVWTGEIRTHWGGQWWPGPELAFVRSRVADQAIRLALRAVAS